jgi:uncharacterized phage protein gp47/JayE
LAIQWETFQSLFKAYKDKVQEEKPSIDPTIKGSFSRAFGLGIAAVGYAHVILQKALLKQFFPQTSTGIFLELWASYDGIFKLGEVGSSGNIKVYGVEGTIVPASNSWLSDAGVIYSNTSASSIVDTNDGSLEPIYALVLVESTTTGLSTNLDPFSDLTLQATIPDILPDAISDEYGLRGGADDETDESLLSRLLLSRSTQEGVFTPSQVILAALSVPGNTRVYLTKPNGGTILPGQIKVKFLRDDDPISIIPSPSIIATTKQAILDNGKLPANSWESDIFVDAPDLVSVDFTFSELTPNTGTMQNSITNSLDAYFTDEAEVGVTVDLDIIRAVVKNTQDLETGDFVKSFSISLPSGNVLISEDELPQLGITTYPV